MVPFCGLLLQDKTNQDIGPELEDYGGIRSRHIYSKLWYSADTQQATASSKSRFRDVDHCVGLHIHSQIKTCLSSSMCGKMLHL